MNKLALTVILALSLGACKTMEPIVKTEYVDRPVPVATVPKPPKVDKPTLETTKLTEEDRKDIGIVSKAIVIENKQLKGLVGIYELIINTYDKAADASGIKTYLKIPGWEEKPDQPKP